jgi:acyl-CoA synthetase (AMP-forming)/AMP-acid ligase II
MNPIATAPPTGLTNIAQIPAYWARVSPDAVAIWQDDAPITYAALQRAVQTAANLLRQQGVDVGDRVMIVSENCVAQIAMMFAATSLGAWPMVVNARLSAREVDALRALASPRVTVFTTSASTEAVAHASRLDAVPVQAPEPLLQAFAVRVDPAHRGPEPQELAREVALLMATSGSTGVPKGVLVTHRGLLHFCRVSVDARRMRCDDVVHAVLPISHIFGVSTQLLVTLYAGASLYLEASFTPQRLLLALERRAISMLPGVPTLFVRLLTYLRESGVVLPPHVLRYAYVGGAALEAVLNAHVSIQLSAVLGAPAADGNEDVVAFVQMVPGHALDPATLRQWLVDSLAPYKRPNRWIELPALPLLANGKLARQVLHQLLVETPT